MCCFSFVHDHYLAKSDQRWVSYSDLTELAKALGVPIVELFPAVFRRRTQVGRLG
jgi:hypothetical protein